MRLALPLVLAAAFGLSACVTVFPEAEPALLYDLSPVFPAASASAAPGGVRVIQKGPTGFTRVGSGDQIMTSNGNSVAAIAGARWAGPVQILFDEALVQSFDQSSSLSLITRSGGATPDMVLRVEVRTFEARYLAGEGAAPTVIVEARADLNPLRGSSEAASQLFRAEVPAADNRVGAIVTSYEAASAEVLNQIVRWTETVAGALPDA